MLDDDDDFVFDNSFFEDLDRLEKAYSAADDLIGQVEDDCPNVEPGTADCVEEGAASPSKVDSPLPAPAASPMADFSIVINNACEQHHPLSEIEKIESDRHNTAITGENIGSPFGSQAMTVVSETLSSPTLDDGDSRIRRSRAPPRVPSIGVSHKELHDQHGSLVFQRAMFYTMDRRVLAFRAITSGDGDDHDDDDDDEEATGNGFVLLSLVKGTATEPYAQEIVIRNGVVQRCRCDCPLEPGYNGVIDTRMCKHALASVLAYCDPDYRAPQDGEWDRLFRRYFVERRAQQMPESSTTRTRAFEEEDDDEENVEDRKAFKVTFHQRDDGTIRVRIVPDAQLLQEEIASLRERSRLQDVEMADLKRKREEAEEQLSAFKRPRIESGTITDAAFLCARSSSSSSSGAGQEQEASSSSAFRVGLLIM